jgi:hypothetical protein
MKREKSMARNVEILEAMTPEYRRLSELWIRIP